MHFRSKIYLIIAILNIVLTIPLAKLYGGIGCAIATAFALFIGNVIIINIYYHKKIGIDIIAFAREITLMTLPVLIALAIGIIGNYLIRITSILDLGIRIIAYTLVFLMLMWFMGFNDYEKDLFKGVLLKVKEKVASIN